MSSYNYKKLIKYLLAVQPIISGLPALTFQLITQVAGKYYGGNEK